METSKETFAPIFLSNMRKTFFFKNLPKICFEPIKIVKLFFNIMFVISTENISRKSINVFSFSYLRKKATKFEFLVYNLENYVLDMSLSEKMGQRIRVDHRFF